VPSGAGEPGVPVKSHKHYVDFISATTIFFIPAESKDCLSFCRPRSNARYGKCHKNASNLGWFSTIFHCFAHTY